MGTSERVRDLLGRKSVHVVSNPEFLREGTAVKNSFAPDRTVVGADDARAASVVGELFEPTGAPLVVTDARTAELIKYAANTFLTTKLSFINAMARLCDALGADVDDLVSALGHDARIGSSYLSPGPGWGGPCLPKDLRATLAIAADAGVELAVVDGAVRANEAQFDYVAARTRQLAGGELSGVTIGVLGLTFKSHTDDRRDSPALQVIARLLVAGARVVAFDPSVEPAERAVDLEGVVTVGSALEVAHSAHVIVVLTEWPEFRSLDFSMLRDVVATPVIFDTRGVIDVERARAAGFAVHQLGRP